MAGFESPEFLRLYTTYTASPDGIGRHLAQVSIDQGQDDPLIVATGQDMAHFPGGGASPTIEGFRGTTAGFKELTAISHLGPAVASLVRLRTAGDETWRDDAERLLTELESTRAANSVELWRDQIAVEAFRGRETEIAAMVDYSCAVTTRYLSDALADEDHLTPETLRSDYLDSGGTVDAPVPINSMMIATFFLVIMDTSYRLTRWLQSEIADWERRDGDHRGTTGTSNRRCHAVDQQRRDHDPRRLALRVVHRTDLPRAARPDLRDTGRRGPV